MTAWTKALEIRMAQGWKLKGNVCPVLYTDTINGDGVGRDDLWLATTAALATEQHALDSKELRRLLGSAMQTMSELHVSAAPDESTADIDARIPGAAFAKFVNEHAQLLFEIKNGCAAAPTPTLPAAAVAEGAQLDGESLEQGE